LKGKSGTGGNLPLTRPKDKKTGPTGGWLYSGHNFLLKPHFLKIAKLPP